MMLMRRLFIICLAAALASTGLSACVTQQQVREIVAESNAAMITPYLEVPGRKASDSDDWKDSVTRIDQLIAANPDQKTLVNHLRVRQAMLLTVYKQSNLAEQRWKDVDYSALTNARDKSLYENRESLVWWYKRSADGTPLSDDEIKRGRQGKQELTTTLANLKDKSIILYLATIEAQISLRLANEADVSSAEKQAIVAGEMVWGLEQYVNHFSEQDQQWVRNNPTTTDISGATGIADFRNRVWLREVIKAFQTTAANLELSDHIVWMPAWIGDIEFN